MQTAKVIAVKRSEVKPENYYVTVENIYGQVKVMGTRNYPIGTEIKIKKKNPVDNIWVIVK